MSATIQQLNPDQFQKHCEAADCHLCQLPCDVERYNIRLSILIAVLYLLPFLAWTIFVLGGGQ
jgi:hypothetical protein